MTVVEATAPTEFADEAVNRVLDEHRAEGHMWRDWEMNREVDCVDDKLYYRWKRACSCGTAVSVTFGIHGAQAYVHAPKNVTPTGGKVYDEIVRFEYWG